jgi:hypothetical protein
LSVSPCPTAEDFGEGREVADHVELEACGGEGLAQCGQGQRDCTGRRGEEIQVFPQAVA